MQLKKTVDEAFATAANGADDAVGVESSKWYIAIVNNHSERICSEKLTALGYENYVPTQTVIHKWKNGKTKTIDQVVLSSMVFIRTTEHNRKARLVTLPFIKRFMTDPARKGASPVAVVPETQMKAFRFMMEHADSPVLVGPAVIKQGDRVRVVSGRLTGMEGIVSRSPEGKSRLYLSLDILGSASVEIDRNCLEPLNN